MDGEVINVQLANGRVVQLLQRPKPVSVTTNSDQLKNYGHVTLELGLLFKALQDMIHLPDRDRGLRLLKLAMIVFKADNNLSKYALEILRLLIHQICTLSEKAANEEFYGLFVNTKGHVDSNIPVDLCMEHQVRTIKRHLRHMTSNKNEKTVMKRSCAIPGLRMIGRNYDKMSQVVIRAKKHSKRDSTPDELSMLNDLRQVRPFRYSADRAFKAFPKCPTSVLQYMKCRAFHEWLIKHKNTLPFELGN